MTLLPVLVGLLLAGPVSEKPAIIVEAGQLPAKIAKATVISPADGPPIVLYEAASQTDQQIGDFVVIAFVFRADGSLKAKQQAPGRHLLEKHETKYSTLVLDVKMIGGIDPTDTIVIGMTRLQYDGSDRWVEADVQPAAEAAVPKKR